MSEGRPCRKCRAFLEFIPNQNGELVPAQKVTQLYIRLEDGPLGPVRRGAILPTAGDLYISHFQTCPGPEEFTKKKKGLPDA